MVFSLSNQKPQSVLKVVDIDRLKPGKSPQVKVEPDQRPDSPAPRAHRPPEEYFKTEHLIEDNMYHYSDGEFFQDLGLWCSEPAKDEQITISESQKESKDRAHTTDTPHTPFSPLEWETFDSTPAGAAPPDLLSPPLGGFLPYEKSTTFTFDAPDQKYLQEQFLDLDSLPIVIGDEAKGDSGIMPGAPAIAPSLPPVWLAPEADVTRTYTTPFIDTEDSLGNDMKYITWAGDPISNKLSDNDVILSEFIVEDKPRLEAGAADWRSPAALTLDFANRPPVCDVIKTPDILSYVEQLEKETFIPITIADNEPPDVQSLDKFNFNSLDIQSTPSTAPSKFSPATSKTESPEESSCDEEPKRTRKRRLSEESDETYTPYSTRHKSHSTRPYQRRKPSVPIEDLITALEDSQQQNKVRRGRPPKRPESTVSSCGSVDDSSRSSHEVTYRKLRDKNNEASKRSRMNRKLKELQMEHLAEELDRRNQQLKVKAGILEDLTKRLRDALMQAMLSK
ncbi:hypothetical protein EVAR_6658_1 [Eumeta japonica]|uniref:BZIP domain-containing protein n=1 Tax=Eumeta variegata TaxID=151549 RepID=A0A4C1TKF0_EUMVA|nr:hypothetical protein EVAR_6658_1 [Eumeta japonica]